MVKFYKMPSNIGRFTKTGCTSVVSRSEEMGRTGGLSEAVRVTAGN